jgi:F-type H+-transporting ATPase subunit a
VSAIKSPKVIIGVLVAIVLMVASRIFFPITLPHVTLAPEPLRMIGPLPFTNTMLTLVIAEVILLVLAVMATRGMKLVPGGLQNFFEAVVEFWENQANQLIGPALARSWLPLVLTVFCLIWFSNYLHFVPGFDSIGILCKPGTCPGEVPVAQQEELTGAVMSMGGKITHHTTFAVAWPGGTAGEGVGLITGKMPPPTETTVGGAPVTEEGYVFIPYFRVPASDLNFTLALAILCFLAVEIVGFRKHGAKYLTKFFHFDFSHGIGQGLLNLFVGLIELISELARMISWSFRLFGNIFAGSVLMVVFMFLVPFLLVVPIYALELFVGLIQAFVFAILILAFITLAVAPLHGDEH